MYPDGFYGDIADNVGHGDGAGQHLAFARLEVQLLQTYGFNGGAAVVNNVQLHVSEEIVVGARVTDGYRKGGQTVAVERAVGFYGDVGVGQVAVFGYYGGGTVFYNEAVFPICCCRQAWCR